MAQVTDVQTALGSVNQMLKAGNLVHFEPGNCYVRHLMSGKTTPFQEKTGAYEIGVWVRKGNKGTTTKDKGTNKKVTFQRKEANAQ